MTVTIERLIYTAGTLKFTDDLRQCRKIWVYCDVLRKPPSAVYQNERSNPPKNFLGYVSLMIDEYVVKVIPLEYEHQLIFEYDNLDFQLYKTINCVGALIIDGLVALGTAMTPPAILIPITPTPAEFPGCPYVWLKFKLEPLTRLKVVAYGDEAIGCDGVTFPVSLPDPPPPPTPYPPSRPLIEDPARSEPEEGEEPNDTKLADEDDPDLGIVPPEFPQGNHCVKCYVFVSIEKADGGTLSTTIQAFGEIENITLNGTGQQLIIVCYGEWLFPYSTCPDTLSNIVAVSASAGLLIDTLTYTITPA